MSQADDDLRQLLRGSSTPPAEKGARQPRPAQTTETADLHALLRQGSGNFSPPAERATQRTTDAPTASIHDLLRASTATSEATTPHRHPAPQAKTQAAPPLNQLLQEVQAPPLAGNIPQRRSAGKTAELSETLHAVHDDPGADDSSATRKDFVDSPWLARTGWALLITLTIGIGLWWQHRPLDGAPGTLQSLAEAVEGYHKQHGYLPDQLTSLPAFPKNSVEWPVKQWRARDAAGRTEIIWIPNGNRHYRIVLRQGDAVWLYSDKEGKARRTDAAGK